MLRECPVCGKTFYIKPSKEKRNQISCCSMKCANEIRKTRYLGEDNPNAKYKYDRNFFKEINTEFKAWLLGWIASDGNINSRSITICIHQKDIDVLQQIQDNFCSDIPIKRKNETLVYYSIPSKEIINDVCNILNIKPSKKSHIISVPKLDNNEMIRHFLRGYFEGDGSIRKVNYEKRSPECNICSYSDKMLTSINEISPKCSSLSFKNHSIAWYGVNALDFLGFIYNDSIFKMKRKYELYQNIAQWKPALSTYIDNNIYFQIIDKDAIKPFKSRVSDSGYDLCLINKIKTVGEVEYYGTGIKVKPPFGYYFDLVPRSSITKSGYILANNIGVIDMSYVGEIIVPLIKIDKNSKDLELPSRLVQLIPRKIEHFDVIQVDTLDKTERGEGGFGSTGV